MFKEFTLDDFTIQDMGMEASVNYRRLIKLCEAVQRHGISVYGHRTWGGWEGGFKYIPVLDVNDIWNAVCLTLAKAYAEEHK